MSFGKDLQKTFHELTDGVFYYEDELITKLQDALYILGSTKYHGVAELIHGERSMISFQLDPHAKYPSSEMTNPVDLTTERVYKDVAQGFFKKTDHNCELADIMFIVFDEKELRLMYLQNKRTKKEPKIDGELAFIADIEQLMLLTFRPEISTQKGKRFPECAFHGSILADALLPSIGSYGVFYQENGQIDMQYYPANRIYYDKYSSSEKPTVRFNLKKENPKYGFGEKREKDGYTESIGEKTLIDFGNELVNLHIGTPIRRKEDKHTLKQIVSFLKNRSRVFTQSDYFKQVPSDIMDDMDHDQQETDPLPCCKALFVFDRCRLENI